MPKASKIILIVFLSCISLFLLLFDKVERKDHVEFEYYKKNQEAMDSLKLRWRLRHRDTVKANWAKVNLVPPFSLPMAGYGKRKGAHFEGVRDSLYVRTLYLENSDAQVYLISADLLIIHPSVKKRVEEKMDSLGLNKRIFYTATHSHSSIGGWAPGVLGWLFAGSYHEKAVEWVSNCMISSILESRKNPEPAVFNTAKIAASKLVYHRISEQSSTDPFLRLIRIQQSKSGKTALLGSFSAHATTRPSMNMNLSADYPGSWVRQLEEEYDLDMAFFMAGAVGSTGPNMEIEDKEDMSDAFATALKQRINTKIFGLHPSNRSGRYSHTLFFHEMPLKLREPHYRIYPNLRFRPWVFRFLAGEQPIHLSFLKVGDMVLAGTPADFSSEISLQMEEAADSLNSKLHITSFNGAYIGYITADRWYWEDTYESMAMNWYGPYNGRYFKELIIQGMGIMQ